MTQTSFAERLSRLETRAAAMPAAVAAAPAHGPAPQTFHKPDPRKAPIWALLLMGLVLVPVAMAFRMATQVALDPDVTRDAVQYEALMFAVLGYHVVLLGCAVTALLMRLRRPMLNWAVLHSMVGYGLMAALLNAFLE